MVQSYAAENVNDIMMVWLTTVMHTPSHSLADLCKSATSPKNTGLMPRYFLLY